MGLFDQVMQSINDPNRQASQDQLGQILGMAQQISGQTQASPDQTQQIVSVLGAFVRSSLQETQASQGTAQVQALVDEGSRNGPAALAQLLSPQQQDQIAQIAAQKTGLDPQMIQSLLPMLLPLVMKFLKTGEATQAASESNNTVLDAFLDADGDGDVDMGDMLGMAGRFMR